MNRQKFLKLFLVTVLACASAAVGYIWPYPDRWNETLVGLSRKEVLSVLGSPNADFSPKGWEGWNRNRIFGAWVLKVYYDEKGTARKVEKKFDWGFDYLSWDDDVSIDAAVKTYTARLPIGDWEPSAADVVSALDYLKHDSVKWLGKRAADINHGTYTVFSITDFERTAEKLCS